MEKLTDIELKRQLHYDPLTGYFIWVVSNSNRVKIGDLAGYKRKDGYIRIKINDKLYFAHRLAWLYTYGYLPENYIDHINRVRDNNRILNLREVNRQCNARNSNTQINNTSGIVGVHWHKRYKKWKPYITVNNKLINLGVYESKTDAAKARWDAEVQYGFPNCNTISTSYLYLKERNMV